MNSILSTPRRLTLALGAAGAIGATGAGLVTNMRPGHAEQPPAQVTAAVPTAPISGGGVAMPDFAQITARNGAAVVNISVVGTTKTSDEGDDGDDASAASAQQRGMQGMDPDDPFFQFFKRFGFPGAGAGGGPGMPQQRNVPMRGEGSGFIVSPDGVILTNAHVVKGASSVTVKLTDRREFRAKVLGSDPKTDIAVLKINAKDLPVVQLGSTKNLAVGEWVLAIGSPFGFENSVTAGVVSAKGRALPDDSFVPFIQTDVAVNPGNSGGPLFNTRGQVVGINSQIYSRSGGYQGVSFAIPIEVAERVKDQIMATGKASHARLGVSVQEVNQAFADSFQLPKPEGALVAGVEPGGPADKAGLKSGDVILSINGQPIVASGDLPAFVGQAAPGTKATMEIWRRGKQEELVATLGDVNDTKASQVADASQAVGKGQLGLALRPLQPQERRDSGIETGLVIEQVRGPAALAGVEPGDVLLAINGTPAKSLDQVREAVAKSGKSVALLIERDGNRIFVPVQLG